MVDVATLSSTNRGLSETGASLPILAVGRFIRGLRGENTTSCKSFLKQPVTLCFVSFFLIGYRSRVGKTRALVAPVKYLMLKLGKSSVLMLLWSLSTALAAAPVGYSINSDSPLPSPYSDALYEIDLGVAGSDRHIAQLSTLYLDVEGLAFAPDEKLYALDDETLTILELVPGTNAVQVISERAILNLPSKRDNDFGMTFDCDGTLFVSSIKQKTLYSLDLLTGQLTPIGALGANISALAAWGNPTELYGLGNGLRNSGNDIYVEDAPNLYRIDASTGATSLIGELGDLALPYTEGGLDFDETGQLWAITDRQFPVYQPSQVLRLDKTTGRAMEARTLREGGFESLAIAPPGGCTQQDDSPPLDAPPVDPPAGANQYKGVPALSPIGLALASLLVLLTGLLATRRF
jgi:hypothetical protein